ncbi:MAG: hypothetical protein V4497_09395 [Bacteroidota bacterium]
MKTKFTVHYEGDFILRHIIVSNYILDNQVYHWMYCDSPEECRKEKTKFDVGFWKLKNN